ncbi:hypothetical protein H5P28_14895 [Ruficoccus amylovorans]|uniref:Uncharacterized protein n=1 Tax=Ruficoccus amylovorans TaxID=1804625 RepID=A0A842HGK4_9BACT|nr:hypothetical protein [Ruficoccus amylovorans]MBC2595552.1 hypothetical protein [Ruficoccus amylovorans]
MEWILLAVVGGAFVIVCVAAVMTHLRNFRKMEVQMRQLGETLGLELTVPPASMLGLYRRNPTLYGRFRGREISIFPKGYGLDNTRQTDIAIRVATRAPSKLRFTVARQKALAKLGQVGRLKYTPTGDPDFDREFSIRSNDPEKVASFFGRERQRVFETEWVEGNGFLELSDGTLTYLEFGLPYDESKRLVLEHMAVRCCDLAEELDLLRG